MAFYGAEFIFDSKSSTQFDLRILDFETSGVKSSGAGSESTLMEKWLYRKERPYLYGRLQNTPLEFDITIGSLNYIPGYTRNLIEKWLLGRNSYLPMSIVQEDISNIIFNVFFTKAENIYIGNVQTGMKLHGKCDSPFGFESSKTLTKTYGAGDITNEQFNFYNTSDNEDYLWPIVSFTTNSVGTSFSITNQDDRPSVVQLSSIASDYGPPLSPGREFSFTGLSANETIDIDNYRKTITSSTGLLRLTNFNKNFFRLVPNLNRLTIVGGISNFEMTYQFARKVGY